jgi:hypothetical protein
VLIVLRLDLKLLLAISAKKEHSQVDGMTAEMKRVRDRRIAMRAWSSFSAWSDLSSKGSSSTNFRG